MCAANSGISLIQPVKRPSYHSYTTRIHINSLVMSPLRTMIGQMMTGSGNVTWYDAIAPKIVFLPVSEDPVHISGYLLLLGKCSSVCSPLGDHFLPISEPGNSLFNQPLMRPILARHCPCFNRTHQETLLWNYMNDATCSGWATWKPL